ncbi:zinc-dependent alcohol dehydrogenase [Parahaliea mediterranea]|uniref:Alcohol dehydrogenase catalytic domain-containing protein n=1 Tax=Parahaliea mediterranea TaxID=651086 RepID=A0A939IM71_9GAMM|nr:alcohol dehydrogenase catalytic domain-containing protein [Parahaliea mediterranea]MBN7796728.1 alcohol dehydrogenase catalytic domain-containing protein [Parahaliea mediterranea]
MRAIQIIDGQPQLVHQRLGEADADSVRIKVAASSICGSDLHLIARGWAEGRVLGHEFAGHTPDGTAVAVEPLYGCGDCTYCRDGYLAHCEQGATLLGVSAAGGMAEYVQAPASTLVPLPSGLAVTDACLVEPLAVAVHGIHRARVQNTDRVLVVGAGAIGLAAAAVLQGRGLRFDMAARHPRQQESAQFFGARLEAGDGYDVVLDAVGSEDSLAQAMRSVRPQGRIGVLGSFWQPVSLDISCCMKEVELLPSMTYKCRPPQRSFDEAATLLAGNPAFAGHLITHRFPLEGAAEAFATAADRASGAIKVSFSPQG